MNFRLVSKVLGLLVLLMGVAMSICDLYGWVSIEKRDSASDFALLISAAACLGIGGAMVLIGKGSGKDILRKEAIAIVGLGWVVCAALGALPYTMCVPALGYAGAFFESASGFTTTGASVIPELSVYSREILLWRAMTQWLGGMGILVLFVALLSLLGAGSKSLIRHESTVQFQQGAFARIRQVAVRLWLLYVALTAVCSAGLILLGMTVYDSVLITFSTLSTGGFSPHIDNSPFFGQPPIAAWLILFMFLGGTNFLLLVGIFTRRGWAVLRDEEFRLYVAILALASFVIALVVYSSGTYANFFEGFLHSTFQAVSIMTTTGFASADFNQWPMPATMILLVLMLLGGCVGSTAGSIKIQRVLVLAKSSWQEVINAFRPNQVLRVRINGVTIDEGDKHHAVIFVALVMGILCVSAIVLSLLEPGQSMLTVVSAVVTTTANVGPGFDAVGPMASFACFGDPALYLLSFLMILGRLELFAILALFVPMLWKKY